MAYWPHIHLGPNMNHNIPNCFCFKTKAGIWWETWDIIYLKAKTINQWGLWSLLTLLHRWRLFFGHPPLCFRDWVGDGTFQALRMGKRASAHVWPFGWWFQGFFSCSNRGLKLGYFQISYDLSSFFLWNWTFGGISEHPTNVT